LTAAAGRRVLIHTEANPRRSIKLHADFVLNKTCEHHLPEMPAFCDAFLYIEKQTHGGRERERESEREREKMQRKKSMSEENRAI
jgi:hypothetical protein